MNQKLPPPKHTAHGNYLRADYFEAECERVREELATVREHATAHHKALAAENDTLRAEATALVAERDQFSTDWDVLAADFRALERQLAECKRMIAMDTVTVNSQVAMLDEWRERIKQLEDMNQALAAANDSLALRAAPPDFQVAPLVALVLKGLAVVEDFMPSIGGVALQDYARLNEFLIEATKLKPKEPQT